MSAVIIPFENLSARALYGVVEEFVTRDGTDYGDREISLETKISNVMHQLKKKKAVVVFDNSTQTCTILSINDPAVKALQI